MAERVGGLTVIDTDEISSTELREEIDKYDGEVYAWRWHDDRGQGFAVVVFDVGRTAVETNGDAEWYDGTDPAEAVDKCLRGEYDA